ncbi:MAG: alpha/beta fold hydrolase [Pseudomonadota bacterium]
MSARLTEEERFEAEFETRLETILAQPSSESIVRPFLYEMTVACGVLGRNNDVVWHDAKLKTWIDADRLSGAICERVRSQGVVEHALIDDVENRPLLLTYAPTSIAQAWLSVLPALDVGVLETGAVVVCAVSLGHLSDELHHAARALGLSNLEARVCTALFTCGSTRRAAAHAGVTYNTARKALALAMSKLNISRKTALVRKLAELATASAPSRDDVERIFIDIFGLKGRQASLALLLCEGHTRASAAKALGISYAVAKDHFAQIFEKLSVESAADIPRLVMEAFTAAMLAGSAAPPVFHMRREKTPLRLFQRTDHGLIAASDYGPPAGQPVLIVHSSVSTRHPFRKVVTALQDAGFRPVTIDRPGFGLSDDVASPPDPFEAGADDVALVCAALGFEKIDVLTRGGAFHALALARRYADLIGRVVVINPDLLQEHCSQRKGHIGVVRAAFDRYPGRIEEIAKWVGRQLTPERARTIIRMGIEGSDVDCGSFEDRENMDDYCRSVMAFSTGRINGFVREQRGYATLPDVEGVHCAQNWTILLGEDDPIHDPAEILAFWRKKLPGATVRKIVGANRFISLSHTKEVVAALARGEGRKERVRAPSF